MKKAIKKYFKTIKTLKNVITMKKRDKNVFTFMGKEGREGRGRREFVLCPRKKKENSARMVHLCQILKILLLAHSLEKFAIVIYEYLTTP